MLDSYKHVGPHTIFPFWFVLSVALGGLAVRFVVPESLFHEEKWEVTAAFYAGVLAFNAITMALSWSSISKILEITSQKGFSGYLQSAGMLDSYSFYVSFIHLVQVVACVLTLVAFVVLFAPINDALWKQLSLGASLSYTLYALRWSVGAVRVVKDLIWSYAKFDNLTDEERAKIKLAVNNAQAG